MKIRQKMKIAKKQLKLLESKQVKSPSSSIFSSWDVVTDFQKKSKLLDIVNAKRKHHKYIYDESVLKGKEFTYMKFSCGLKNLAIAKNANGRPLTEEQKKVFLEESSQALLKHVPVIYNEYKDADNLPDDFHVIYCLYLSVDSTKSKRLFCRLWIYQFKNSTDLYVKEDGKFVKMTSV